MRKEEGLLADICDSTFTVSSTDNIDFLQSHAAVYAGSQHRSYHATSTQIVQPKPRLLRQAISMSGSASAVSHTSSCVGLSGSADRPHGQSTVYSNPSTIVPLQRLCRKRSERSSPISTPTKQTRSPNPKRLRRARTFVEAEKLQESVTPSSSEGSDQVQVRVNTPYFRNTSLCLADFLTSEAEALALEDLQKMLFTYIMLKISLCGTKYTLFGIQDYVGLMNGDRIHSEPSNVVYLSIIDQHADTLSTMAEVATMLYREYLVNSTAEYLVLVGDAKTYMRVKELKQQYGSELDWLIPFVGDWPALHNYQKALMKVYYEAGFKDRQ